jgi:hypothetical protein
MRASPLVLFAATLVVLPLEARAQGNEVEGLGEARTVSPVTPAAYVSDGRRDPFVPLTGTYASDETGAPRLEQLKLTGVFLGSPGNSLVVLEDPTRRGHFVRVGEALGNARLLEILPDGAVFEVDDYGLVRRDTLRLVPDRAPPPATPAAADSGSQEEP